MCYECQFDFHLTKNYAKGEKSIIRYSRTYGYLLSHKSNSYDVRSATLLCFIRMNVSGEEIRRIYNSNNFESEFLKSERFLVF